MSGLPVWVFFAESAERQHSRSRALFCARLYAAEFGLVPPLHLREREDGKPMPVGSTLGLSISHSGALWACAVHGGEIGLDIQIEEPRDTQAISRRFFCAGEIEYLAKRPEDFFSVWCAKEAAVKYYGMGIARGFSRVCVADGERLLERTDGLSLIHFSPYNGYRACICANANTGLRLFFIDPAE